MDGKMTIDARLDAHLKMMELFAGDEGLKNAVKEAADAIEACFRAGGKVYFCGNGGSAADAQHLAAEFSGKFYIDREVLPAEALHCNTSYMTAVANDYSYDIVYSRLISGVGRKGDILVGISTSGNSGNILKAFDRYAAHPGGAHHRRPHHLRAGGDRDFRKPEIIFQDGVHRTGRRNGHAPAQRRKRVAQMYGAGCREAFPGVRGDFA